MFSIRQQNYSSGTDYKKFSNSGKLFSKTASISYISNASDTLLYQEFSENGNIIFEVKEIKGFKTGVEKKYFDNGQIEHTGTFVFAYHDSILKSLKNGSFKYYFQNGNIKTVINYKNGKQYGKSFFYDDSGILKRMEEIKESGEILNVFKDETVNRTDSIGLKQGKWIDFSSFYSINNCQDKPNRIFYFKDNKPVGTWEYYDYNASKLQQKYIWRDSVLAQYYHYDVNGEIQQEGFMLDEVIKTGGWKVYEKGYLKFKGEYYNGEKEGVWLEYRKNGKVKTGIKYNGGKINRAT